MIFQEPTTSLNPCFTIGFQLAETLRLHLGLDRKAARKRSIELLELVGIPAARIAPARLSAPDVGRHEPARDDRDGHLLQSAAAHRRRAHHRARRHHPGADPRPAAAAAARAEHGARARHAQHGRGGRHRATRGRDVCGTGDGGARRVEHLCRAPASVHRGAAVGDARAARGGRQARDDSRARARPGRPSRAGAFSRRAVPTPPRGARNGRSCARGTTASCAATIRSRCPSATRSARRIRPCPRAFRHEARRHGVRRRSR